MIPMTIHGASMLNQSAHDHWLLNIILFSLFSCFSLLNLLEVEYIIYKFIFKPNKLYIITPIIYYIYIL